MQPLNASPLWIGLDVAKASFEAAAALPDHLPREFPTHLFARTEQGAAELLAWAERIGHTHPTRIVLEATGRYSHELAGWLLEKQPASPPAIVNGLIAKRFIQSLGLRNKTDRCDARALARLGQERSPEPWQPLSPALEELRALTRERHALVGERTALTLRIAEKSPSSLVAKERQNLLNSINDTIARIEAAMEDLCRRTPEFDRDTKLLRTIPGVGPVTATTVLAELGDLRRFRTSRQLTAYAGVSPRQHISGAGQARTRMCKQGNPQVRAVLYMSATCQARLTNTAQGTHYRHLKEAGLAPMAALGALMRKTLVIMRAILITGKHYQERTKP